MGKKLTSEIAATSDGNGRNEVAQRTTLEDNILPSSEELSRYAAIDPNLVPFIMETTKKEQEHRHIMDSQSMNIIRKSDSNIHCVNIVGMIFAFLIIITGLVISGLLIYLDKTVVGSLFAGVTIITGASMFIYRDQNKKK